MKVSLVKVFYD